MQVPLPNGIPLNVSPAWLRHLPQERIMVLHFWQDTLSDYQLSAVAGILRLALTINQPRLSVAELDLISVSKPDYASGRRLRRLDWAAAKPLIEDDMDRYLHRISTAWEEYQRRPRNIARRGTKPDLFNR